MTRISILLSAAALGAGAAPAFAATPVPPAEAHVLILAPLTFTNIDDLDFGTVVSSNTAGTVTINALSGARTRTGGVTLMSTGVGGRGYFGGAGSGGQQVIVTMVPPTELVHTTVPANTIPVAWMALDNGDVTATRTIDMTTKTFFIGVGGTILVNADQPDGDYESTYFIDAQYQM
jgi:hypothetical protein